MNHILAQEAEVVLIAVEHAVQLVKVDAKVLVVSIVRRYVLTVA